MTKQKKILDFNTLDDLASHLRSEMAPEDPQQKGKDYLLLFAHNGIGKTRLSMAFKDKGKQHQEDGEAGDTLYFNAFTEDLFTWDNDLEGDRERVLKLNASSRFFKGLESLEMESRIGPLLERYADFDFKIDYEEWSVSFSRPEVFQSNGSEVKERKDSPPLTETVQATDSLKGELSKPGNTHIKISRGEESIFIWCFFLAIVEIAMDEGIEAYQWVRYLYIDDPVSSLDENNIIMIAHHLAQILTDKKNSGRLKTMISSHHTLFFNVIFNELKHDRKLKGNKWDSFFLSHLKDTKAYQLRETKDTPFFHHIATLIELKHVADNGELQTHHLNSLRTLLEKSATFHGFKEFSSIIKEDFKDPNDPDENFYARLINILNHGKYSLYEPVVMIEDNKDYFRKALKNFMDNYTFNPELFESEEEESP